MLNNEELLSEKKYLANVLKILNEQLEFLNNSIFAQEKNLTEASQYLSANHSDMDIEEQGVASYAMEQLEKGILALAQTKQLKERQRQSPYFGRIDFMANDESKPNAYYIGIAHIGTANKPLPLVVDWRAPLSSMYYDFEPGSAEYFAPAGNIKGQIFLKRQYKTENGTLAYAFDASLTIGDEILRAELGKNASAKLKTIVATIQAEQNKIIRCAEGQNLLVQGVAGSGKTVIALHRVAYLLYKNHISASDILIISPSGLFSDYISNVLPELGEADAPKMTFEEIASSELEGFVRFLPKVEMQEAVLEGNDKVRLDAIQQKSSFEFFENLKKFLKNHISVSFKAKDIKMDKAKIRAEEIDDLYSIKYHTKTPAVRIEWIADFIVDRLDLPAASQKPVFDRTKKVLFGMLENSDIVKIYAEFLKTQNLFVDTNGKKTILKFEDVPAVLYIKNYLMGITTHKHYKHIVIDEMQDYTPITLALFDIIFPAPKTILGDIHQTLEKNLSKTYLKKLAKCLAPCSVFNLSTTYRSTLQIAKYCQKIIGQTGTKFVNRQGEKVQTLCVADGNLKPLESTLQDFCKQYSSVAIITPTKAMAEQVHAKLDEDLGFVLALDGLQDAKQRFLVMPVALCKGLEFDAVVFVDKKGKSKLQRNIKYVACSRALHALCVAEI